MPGLNEDTVERQEIHCHNCDRYVQFDIDLALDGNHVLHCPNCDHEHCRVVKRGRITDERWDSRNGPTISISQVTITYSVSSTANTMSTGMYLYSTGTTAGMVIQNTWAGVTT